MSAGEWSLYHEINDLPHFAGTAEIFIEMPQRITEYLNRIFAAPATATVGDSIYWADAVIGAAIDILSGQDVDRSERNG